MAQQNLTVVKGGITRQRTKGAALKDSLYDLLNGYVTTEKTVKVRPGTLLTETLPAGTVGLYQHNSLFQVFASSNVSNIPTGYNLNIVRAPDGSALSKIHFAEPFLGSLYVVAEFADGDIYHYWLRTAADWAADTQHQLSDRVRATTDNSYIYVPSRYSPAFPVWTAGAPRTVGDKVEPTTYNGYYFEVVEIFGSNARSGDTEPSWQNVVAGQRINENVDGTNVPPPAQPPGPPYSPPPGEIIEDRYWLTGRLKRNITRTV